MERTIAFKLLGLDGLDPLEPLTKQADSCILKGNRAFFPCWNHILENLMKNWKEKILQSDAGRAKPELAELFISETEKNGAEVLELSPLVGSPSQVSRSPAKAVREEVLALAPVLRELVRKDIRKAAETPDE